MSSVAWDASAEDFGQKVDLTVRIREILRNYPEGLSILKELIQNADDAGARTVRFCTAEPRPNASSQSTDALSELMKGPSLIAYNSAKFSETDFKSIQRIGDSLKKDKNGTKTGRFGVGVNSTYHLTDVPMFASGTKVVMFDPQASFVPGINPANPGKMIDCSKTQGRNLVKSLPHVFDPLKVFGCNLSGEDFNGTMFRFALRTDDQAKVSRLSRQSHLLPATRDLLHQMASAAPLMLIFLKNVECIEIYDWKANNASPSMISRTAVGNASDKLRMRRSYVLNAPSRVPAKPQAVDYILDIETTGVDTAKTTERWMVCNQLGGGNASVMANDPALSHMKLVPWAGVAARISPSCEVDGGNAYCFLPLPVKTKLPIHVNGYFELSSNRRDVWWGDDMAGDGKARADWNRSIVRDIAAPSYIRLLTAAIRTKLVTQTTYEQLFPQKELSGPWKVLCDTFLNGLRDCPVLYSECSTVTDHWVAPSKSLLLHDEKDEKLSEILAFDKLLLVRFKSSELKSILLQHGTCKNTTTPELLRRYFSNRKERPNGCLEQENTKNEHAEYLLKYCKSDLSPTQYHNLSGCQFIPLASGDLGKFCTLPSYDQSGLAQLQVMGFSKLLCIHALRVSKDNVDTAMEWLLANRYSDEAVAVQYGVDPYLLCDKDSASLLRESAADTFVDLEHIIDPGLRKFFSSGVVSTTLNILPLRGDMLADIVSRAVPSDWRGNESAPWNSQREHPNVQWFVDLWRFICSCDDVGGSLKSVAEQFCIVPTGQGVVCSLSPGNSVVSADGLDDQVVQCLVRAGVRVLFPDVLPVDLVVPPEIYSYIFDTTRDGVIKAIDAASRRKNVGPESLERASDEMKDTFFQYFSSREYCPISTPCKVMLRHFPIFRAYRNNVMSTETTFVPLTRSRVWYVLEGATNDDCTFMTSDFLMASTPADIKLLTLLGAKKMSRSDFFKKVVIPQLSEVDLDVGDRVVERILLDLPSLSDTDHEFGEHLSTIKFIRSSDSKSLRSPSELYDPEVPQLLTLMDQDSFPDEFYMHPNLLLSLRKVGLQSTLSWNVVLDCARSIELEGTRGNDDSALAAKARGSELLLFLDMHVDTFFPEFTKKSDASRTGRFFRKMNSALFEDPEKKKERKELQAKRILELLNIRWMPVHSNPPQDYLPWPEQCDSVAAPVETVMLDKMWLASYSKRLVEGDVHSPSLKQLFGWLDPISIKDVSLQLRMMSKTFEEVQNKIELSKAIDTTEGDSLGKGDKGRKHIPLSALCQKYSSEVGRMYHILNTVESEYEMDVIKSVLHGSAWLWMGDGFVPSDHIAYTSSINATPYLHTVPPDLACYRNLLSAFSIRNTFGSSDYCLVLTRMAQETKGRHCSAEQVELAVNLVQKISDDVLRLNDLEIFAPTRNGEMEVANKLVYDDAPWLSKDLPGKRGLVYVHPKLSASVCEKIGVKSVRKLLLQHNADMISFGDGVVHEAFGQSESLTRRLKNIVEMYPEGTQQLSELIQNADDAKASVVKFVISTKQHGTSSLLGQNMSEWQGGALYCYNDATFTMRDFENLSKIGQASKLEKLVTTGRFGLGFNSVFHWTDVPSIVSGDYLVMFDPHAKYVPGASDMSRGIKIRFSHTDLASQFPDQMSPYCLFGNDMQQRFNGTLFRFPFRNETTAADSEISKKKYGEKAVVEELVENFKKVIAKTLLFLRNVQRVEFYVENESDQCPQLQYYADITDRQIIGEPSALQQSSLQQMSSLESIRSLANNTLFGGAQSKDWNAIPNFIAGDESQKMSKESFYSKLLRTPENQLPKTNHVVTVNFVDRTGLMMEAEGRPEEGDSVHDDRYLICSALGAGQCRAMACNPEHRDLKFLPWGSVAAHLSRNGKRPPTQGGNAFCFLPLPSETGFAVHINGYFELSANRRDIWHGDDMTGAGHVRSEWNRLLLSDVISPLYTQVLLTARSLLGPGEEFNRLWPTKISSDVWKTVQSRVYQLSEHLPLMHTSRLGGKWVTIKSAVFLDNAGGGEEEEDTSRKILPITKKKLLDLLLQENLNIVTISSSIIKCMRAEACTVNEVNPSFVREWFKKPSEHPSLVNREGAVFLLRYCFDDLFEGRRLRQLHGLPLLPLASGGLGKISDPSLGSTFFVVGQSEKYLLEKGSSSLVDVWTDDTRLNGYLMNEDFHSQTNTSRIRPANFVQLLSKSYPPEWEDLPEVHWVPDSNSKEAIPNNPSWVSKLWDYIASDKGFNEDDMTLILGSFQIVPTIVGEGDRTLQMLSEDMAVVNITNFETGGVANENMARILRSIGIRTLDTSVFRGKDKSSIFRLLMNYIQPSTVRGVLTAMTNSFPSHMPNDDIVERMKARFKYLGDSDRKKLRNFLRDSVDKDLRSDEINMLRALPIFEVFNLGNKPMFSHLSDGSFLPPSCADQSHLDHRFVKAGSRKDSDFFSQIEIATMPPQDYYVTYVTSLISQRHLDEESNSALVIKMLQDSLRLSEEENGNEYISRLTTLRFVPNSKGQLVRANELYDPQEAGLVYLVDESMLPAENLRTGALLQSLRILGMSSDLSIEGILESARQIELQAKNLSIGVTIEESEIDVLRKRATALLNFLDVDDTISKFTSGRIDYPNINSRTEEPSSDNGDDIEILLPDNEIDIVNELCSISWLPVERTNRASSTEICPPRRSHQLSLIGISSPEMTRARADEWICSSSLDTLSTNIKSEALIDLFGWNQSPSITVVSSQLVALSQINDNFSESHAYKQQMSRVTSQIYEILDKHLNALEADESHGILEALTERPWIWVGDRFVTTSQVAFNAPENAKPFLYNVPEQMICYDNLLKFCGVRESFSSEDYIMLLSSLANQLQGNACNPKQLDLAIFVARNLSRVPPEEITSLDKSRLYLPSRDGQIFKATDMTYDDAPWLSAIVKKTSHVFVHPDVGNEVARILGSKSLRDVLSANQNGMVKIPCPKYEALQQLLERRTIDDWECCKALLEIAEIAELKGTKQVSIMIDRRSHGTMSLLHPCLAAAQGPALVVCFHDVSMEVDEVVRLTSPAKYYSSTIGGGGGGGGSGFPRYGRGLCGAFTLTDCLQVLTGRSLLIFDPTGNYLIEDKVQQQNMESISYDGSETPTRPRDAGKKEKANARNYGLSHSFCKQFPDQFDPFFSLSVGVEESLLNGDVSAGGPYFRGTIVRMPLRRKNGPPFSICKKEFCDSDYDAISTVLEEAVPRTLLFTYHLQSISLDKWPTGSSHQESVLSCRVSSSPLNRRNHIEEQAEKNIWRKDKSKIGKLFKSSWVPNRGFQLLELSSRRKGDDHDTIDTYAINSVLAPPRLREMACTESLGPLNLIPTVSIAAHLDRSCASVSQTVEYKPPDGTIFVGYDTGVKTGLPFIINVPIFLHEWKGSVLLQKEDDIEFQNTFPGIRNVVITDKHNNAKARSLALYVWNRQAISSAINELVPSLLTAIKEPMQHFWSRNPCLYYKFWPYRNRIRSDFKDFVDESLYAALSSKSMHIYLTERDGFQSIEKGCFASPDYPLNEAANFFLQHMSLFTTPRLVVDDLVHYGIDGKQLTPSVARSLLKGDTYTVDLSSRPREALAVLQYCLADIVKDDHFDSESTNVLSCRRELTGLSILPLADGTIGKIGSQIILANEEQQEMMPMLQNKFLSHQASKMLEPFLGQPGFMDLLGLEKFGPKTLSRNMSKVVPSNWEGKEFVQWNPESPSEPSKLWIYQFWKEVPLSSHDEVQLFRKWPLIPTASGELASCGNARFILYISPDAKDQSLQASLSDSYKLIREKADADDRRVLVQVATESRFQRTSSSSENTDPKFWNMGKVDEVENEDTPNMNDSDDSIGNLDSSDHMNDELRASMDQSSAAQSDNESEASAATATDEEEFHQPHFLDYDPNSDSMKTLYGILSTVRCPLLDASYFEEQDLNKTLPSDRLGVSRIIMSTLNQCLNYWSAPSSSSLGDTRLCWSLLNGEDFDALLSLISSHDGNRLSLMVSDLNLMKRLPIFETFAGNRVSIEEREANFTMDASVDADSITSYLPLSLQSKLLADKPQFKDLYEDLNVQVLNEAMILQKFVLHEFPNMPLAQKEAVIKNILDKWEILRLSDELLNVLKESEFVKRTQRAGHGEVVFVKPSQLYDPRNQLLSTMFDKDRSLFPAEEFETAKALEMLESVGLQTKIDKETFLKCAWIVEEEQDVMKATLLFEYFAEHFGDFYDNSQDFTQNLSEVRCVPGEIDGQVALHRFRETAAPKDRHLCYKVMPVLHDSCAPPQLMYSTLGITSPPSINVVLRQIRMLTEVESTLDHWTYKHGSVEQVFSELFSYLQDNFSDLSPRVKDALSERPLVPVGSSFVKASRLFFRLAKDLAPFFYEVPRAFGAYDIILRQLGVRDSPKSGDYAVSLMELNREIGAAKLNANELNSVVEVVNIAASDNHQAPNQSSNELFAPDQYGKLTSVKNLMQDDRPWLINSGRIDTSLVHLVHPKVSKEICDKLQIQCMSQQVIEVLGDGFNPRELEISTRYAGVNNMLNSEIFTEILHSLVPRVKSVHIGKGMIRNLNVVGVASIQTRFIIMDSNGNYAADITNESSSDGPFCFIDKNRILISQLPIGISCELAVASALCDKFNIQREHVGGLAAVLGSQAAQVTDIKKMMGLFEAQNNDELFRGSPGYPLVATDLELIEIKPLKMFKHNEIVAVRESNNSSHLIYGIISGSQDSASISRLRVCVADGVETTFLSSQVYSLKGGSRVEEKQPSRPNPNTNIANGQHSLLLPTPQGETEFFEDAVNQDRTEMSSIRRDEVLSAVEDLLKSADLSLNDDAKKMMDSNLSLKEHLQKKTKDIENLEKKTMNLSKDAMKGIDAFLCPITRETMEDPVICVDGHTYEREAIEMWLRTNSRSPKTNQALASTELVPNYALKGAIDAMADMHKSLKSFSQDLR